MPYFQDSTVTASAVGGWGPGGWGIGGWVVAGWGVAGWGIRGPLPPQKQIPYHKYPTSNGLLLMPYFQDSTVTASAVGGWGPGGWGISGWVVAGWGVAGWGVRGGGGRSPFWRLAQGSTRATQLNES